MVQSRKSETFPSFLVTCLYICFCSAHSRKIIEFNHPSVIGKEEGIDLFNDALNTFYLRLYGVGHMVKGHQIAREEPTVATWAILSD